MKVTVKGVFITIALTMLFCWAMIELAYLIAGNDLTQEFKRK